MANKNPETRTNKKSLEDVLRDALENTAKLEIKSSRKDSVILALQALLIIRGSIDIKAFKLEERKKLYSTITKQVRAANAESLGALIEEVNRTISRQPIIFRAFGEVSNVVYQKDNLTNSALALLQEETTPLVIMMKKIYQDARGFDEADTIDAEENTNV